MKLTALLLSLTLLGLVNAHVRPSMEKVDTYINEHGTTLLQRTYKDNKRNLLISEVPAHNGLLETKWVFDLDEEFGLMLKVQKTPKSCTIQNGFMGASAMIRGFEAMKSMQETVTIQQPLSQNNIGVIQKNFTFVVAEFTIPREKLPEKFRDHCPENYEVFLSHTVDEGKATPDNPLMAKGSTYEEFYDFQPEEELGHRQKRSTCRLLDGTVLDHCFLKTIEGCPGGNCKAEDLRYNCNNSDEGCWYIVADCYERPGVAKLECILHIQTGNRKCYPCCFNANCGGTGACK